MIPWWGWLIIGVVALAVLVYGAIGLLALKAYRAAKTEFESINLGPPRSPRHAHSEHYTDGPYTRTDASGSGRWPFV